MTEASGWTDADLARLRLEGLEFLNRLQSGGATAHDEVEFLAWRRQSLAHEEAFRAAVRLQRLVRQAHVPAAGATTCADAGATITVPPTRWPRRGPTLQRRAVIGGALAASAAGVVVLGRAAGIGPSLRELRADYHTGAGQRRLVRLAGGATADLNTRTSIAVRADLGAPGLELISGEAIVTSGPRPDARAILVAGRGTSTGRGGRFSARRDGDSVCVTCLTGLVEVAWRDERRALAPSEQLVYDDRRIGGAKKIDPRLVTAWQAGTLIFQNMPMRAVVAEINRYRPGKVILANAALADRPLTGTYYVRRLDDFFAQAQLGLGVTVTRLPGDVVLLS